MATASCSTHTQNSKYLNWIEACLAVLITKEAIGPFVFDEIKQFQQKCLADICNNNGLPSGTICSSCCTENVVVCPTNRICNAGRARCRYHTYASKQYLPAGCPNQICHNFKKEIQNAHRFHGPSYKNTDATQWCSNPWEVAKCFMPPDGYKDVTNPAETDFNGIINVIINNKNIQAKITDDLSKANNIFEKGRSIGAQVRHSPSLEVEDADLLQYYTDLQKLLSDPKLLLASTTDVITARNKLLQLQNDTLVIDLKNFRQMLEDVAKDVQQDLRQIKNDHSKESAKQKLDLIKATTNAVNKIKAAKKSSLSVIKVALKSAKNVIETKIAEGLKIIEESSEKIREDSSAKLASDTVIYTRKLETQSRDAAVNIKAESIVGEEKIEAKRKQSMHEIEVGIKKVKKETSVGVEQVTSLTDKSIKKIEKKMTSSSYQIEDEKYNISKKELRDDLITLYRQHFHTLPLSPLFEEHDRPLLDVYVMPDINKIAVNRSIGVVEGNKSKLSTLKEVFDKGNKSCRNIYLEADAGFGKTAFSKRLLLTWCQSHKCVENDKERFKDEEIKAMEQFEFVFMLSLRDCSEECDIDKMIIQQIVSRLANKSEIIEKVLSNEKCLVILDGLDEWTHPTSQCKLQPKDLPHRKAREKCTILTTARPWKLGMIYLKSSEMDQKLELEGLNEEASKKLKENVIAIMTGKTDKQFLRKQIEDFNLAVTDKGITDMETIPLLLLYLLCLWCDKIDLGRSKCIIYCQMVEFLLQRMFKKFPEMQKICACSSDGFPRCFDEQTNCRENFTFLSSLGQLAFETLFSQKRENTLVFDSEIVDEFLNQSFLQELSLRSGIITQVTKSNLTSKKNKTSFSHKTMQEFFAALYISTCSDQEKVLKRVLSSCNYISDILEMSKVFIFISGINPELLSSISEKLMEVVNKDEITRTHRSQPNFFDYKKYVKPIKEIQNLFISSIKEFPEKTEFKLSLQDFIFDKTCQQENYYPNIQRLAVQNNKDIKSISIEIEGIRSLPEIITECHLGQAINCQKIFYRGECKESELSLLLSKSVNCTCVALSSCEWRKNQFIGSLSVVWSSDLSKQFQKIIHLQAIAINSFKFSHDVFEEFLNYLVNRKSMKEIKLFNLFCTDHGTDCTGCKFDLSQHTQLRSLGLTFLPLSQLNVNVSLLEDCDVGEISNPGIVTSYLSNISGASKLKTFKSSYLKTLDDIRTMLQTLSSLVTVTHVTLGHMNLGESLLPHEIVNIEYVWLYKVTMSSSSLRNLVSWIETLPQQVTVNLSSFECTGEDKFEKFKEYIQTSEHFFVDYDGERVDGGKKFEFTSIK